MRQRQPKAVFTLVEDDISQRCVSRRIGTAYVNRDDSLTVTLDALPLSGRLLIRDIEPVGRAVPLNGSKP